MTLLHRLIHGHRPDWIVCHPEDPICAVCEPIVAAAHRFRTDIRGGRADLTAGRTRLWSEIREEQAR